MVQRLMKDVGKGNIVVHETMITKIQVIGKENQQGNTV